MMKFKEGKASKKEIQIIKTILEEVSDSYTDFYITKSNLRLFLKENPDLLFDCLEKGDKIAYDENKGIILATGWSDKAKRYYIKILAKDEESADHLLKVLNWHVSDIDLWTKIKKKNPIRRILQSNNYRFAGDRGSEILLCKRHNFTEIKQKEKFRGE